MWILLCIMLFASCSKEKFTVNGEISESKDEVLYLENMSLDGPVIVDSVKLGEDGKFEFKVDAMLSADTVKTPNYYPEFYRLRIKDQVVNISADSTETVTVKAKKDEMAWKYDVTASNKSESCQKIRELTQKQIQLQNAITMVARNRALTPGEVQDSIVSLAMAVKEDIKINYIAKEPMKPYAYFALFMTINVPGVVSGMMYNPQGDTNDMKMYRAVATSWDAYYPGSERGLNLHNIAIEGRKNQLIVESQNQDMVIDASKVNTSNIIELNLTDNNGRQVALSSLKGNVVLLDFHAFSQEGSAQYIMRLRDIYDKYHDRGLQIYQVGFDDNEHFWKQSVRALPWINVYDPQGSSLGVYNVTSIPMGYILDRECGAVLRYETLDGLEAEIQKYL